MILTYLQNSKAFKIVIFIGILMLGAYMTLNPHVSPNPTQAAVTATESSETKAMQMLFQANTAMKNSDWETAANISKIVAGDNGISNEIRGSAFMMIGESGIATNHLDVALLSFLIVRALPGANPEDKADAETAIAAIHKKTGDDFEPTVKIIERK